MSEMSWLYICAIKEAVMAYLLYSVWERVNEVVAFVTPEWTLIACYCKHEECLKLGHVWIELQ